MKAIGIRDLKNRLSQLVREVQRGEVVLVTDRGRVVAELRPPGATVAVQVPRGLEALAERGELALGLPNDAALYADQEPCGPPGLAAELLAEERGER